MKNEAESSQRSTLYKVWAPRITKAGWAFGVAGVALWALRYLVQGTSQVWTDTARALYVQDTNLGWVPTSEGWIWLGLEGLGVFAGVLIGSLFMGWLGWRGVRGSRVFKVLGTISAAVLFVAPVLPALAFIGGMPPSGAVAVLPQASPASAEAVGRPGDGPLALPLTARRWVPSPNPEHILVVAQLTAGGEIFDAKFSPLQGSIDLKPEAPMTTSFTLGADPASVSTGIPLRDSHARGYLEAETHKRIEVMAGGLESVSATTTPDEYIWTATMTISLMGRSLKVPATGKVRILPAQARKDLQLTVSEAMVVEGALDVTIADTPIDPELFDTKSFSLTFRAVFVPEPSDLPQRLIDNAP